jgi:uncharacterized membrane protein YdjX (TVP38/TMEM64 family)
MTEGVPRTRESERPRQAWARLCFALGLMIGASACGAPASDPATGLLAEEIQASLSGGSAGFDHSEWGRLLAGGTDRGLVDYSYMQRHREELDVYLARLADADLASLAPDELKALLINAYNALTVSTILDHAGVSSIREIDGVWTALTHRVGGHEVTLDNIEHNLLRPFFRDPRIHFAVNCASMSCAPLPDWAFQGDLLEEQLEERATSFLRDPLNVRVEADRLLVSSYFDWYGEDFTAEGWSPRANTIAEFIARYGNPEVSELVSGASGRVPLEFMDYDWSLNQVSRPDRGGAGSTAPAPATTVDNAADGGTASEGNTTAARGPGDGSKDDESKRWVTRAQDWIVGLGPVAPIAFGLFYVVAVILVIPGGVLTSGAGLAFGMGLGTLVVSLSSTLGASLAFLIARYLLRGRVERWLEGRQRLSAVDRAVERQGWRVVALTRLSPVFPFNVQNYFYGLTGVGFWPYALTSWVAMLPGTVLYVYLGVAGAQVAAALSGAASWGQTALLVAGLAATLLVVVLVTRVAKQELDRVTGEVGPAGAAEVAAG